MLARSSPSLAARALRQSSAVAARRAFTTATADSIPVASIDDGSRTTTLTVALKAGPRYETAAGVSHLLKNSFFKANKKRSALALIREAELYGGILSASSTKEHLLLTAEFLRGDEDFFVEVLGDALSSAKFSRHEFQEEVIPTAQSDSEISAADPLVSGFDQLTATAYRNRSVGASLFISPSAPVSYDQTVQYGRSVIAKNNLAIVGSGIESGKLASLVSKYFAGVPSTASGSATTNGKTQYFGGEQRVPFAPAHHETSARAHNGHFFLAFEGAPQGQSPELAVLRSLLGGESSVKWSSGQSPLAALSAQAAGGAHASAFNLGFSDSGLFGLYVSGSHERLGALAKSAVGSLKDLAGGSAKSEDLQRAIAKAKFEAATVLENRSLAHESVAAQILGGGASGVQSLEAIFGALDKVDTNAVSKAAESLLKSKPTTVVIGDVHKLPYADEAL